LFLDFNAIKTLAALRVDPHQWEGNFFLVRETGGEGLLLLTGNQPVRPVRIELNHG